ncbi:MAG: NAD(P)-dependent oxidoreductase [Alphaproteobacteria bacterium]|nr:NAD(P)-dependent oxidoreductase [Alphaproteobacteria bacterium]
MQEDDKPVLGYVGLGLMGTPMVQRLLAAGYEVHVWNRSPDKTRPATEAGAIPAASPAAMTGICDILFTCVTDTAAMEAVVFGADGFATGTTDASGKVLVDFSSMRPDKAAEFADRLRVETGMGWIDAPVSGGIPGATEGTLAVMAGGGQQDFDRVAPVVAHLAGRFTLMGPNGAGQSTKLINQMLVGCAFTVLAEACQLAEAAGIEVAKIPEALSGGRADSKVLQEYLPRMASGDYAVQGRIDLLVKDLGTVMEESRRLGTSLPMTGLANEIHRLLSRRGLGSADNAATVRLYRDKDAP